MKTPPPPPPGPLKHDMVPPQCDAFSSYKDNFVSEEQAADFIAFFDSEEFKVEGSRKVASYGERYHYKGSTGLRNQYLKH